MHTLHTTERNGCFNARHVNCIRVEHVWNGASDCDVTATLTRVSNFLRSVVLDVTLYVRCIDTIMYRDAASCPARVRMHSRREQVYLPLLKILCGRFAFYNTCGRVRARLGSPVGSQLNRKAQQFVRRRCSSKTTHALRDMFCF